jgi:hypothetical protein
MNDYNEIFKLGKSKLNKFYYHKNLSNKGKIEFLIHHGISYAVKVNSSITEDDKWISGYAKFLSSKKEELKISVPFYLNLEKRILHRFVQYIRFYLKKDKIPQNFYDACLFRQPLKKSPKSKANSMESMKLASILADIDNI